MRYISDLTEDCGDAASFDVCSNQADATNHLGSVVYHDFQASWNADYLGGFKVSVGVNNVFDKKAPNCLSCRSEEHTSELQSLMRISYAVLCVKKKTITLLRIHISYIIQLHIHKTCVNEDTLIRTRMI